MNGRITTEHTVWCLYCPEFDQQPEPTKRDMERVAKALGWRKHKGQWVCPRCVAEHRRAFFDRTTDVPQGQGMQQIRVHKDSVVRSDARWHSTGPTAGARAIGKRSSIG